MRADVGTSRRGPRGTARWIVAAALAIPAIGGAQVTPRPAPPTDTARSARPDTAPAAPRVPRRPRAPVPQRAGLTPPVTPGRAFLSSLLVPGLGQTRLQRPTAGAVFVGIEFGVLAMLVKSNADLHSAKAFRADSVASSYPVDSLGQVLPRPPQQPSGITGDLVRARTLHREDWIAALIFNHLISGAEAFVSANLYDLPAQISVRPTSRGTLVALSVSW